MAAITNGASDTRTRNRMTGKMHNHKKRRALGSIIRQSDMLVP